jgi:CheY-like chemotaxis protein
VKRILIIDDDDVMRAAASASLTRVGSFQVVSTGDPWEGLRLARAELPDGVLLDVNMPGLDGPEVLAALRRDPVTRDIPVVFFTAGPDAVAAEKWTALGASGAVAKPFDFPLLPEQFSRLVGWAPAARSEAASLDPIRGIWEERREEVESRVRSVEEVALALMEGGLTEAVLQDGIRAAHQLAGTLGTFGLTGGGVLAGEAERILRAGATGPGRAAAVRLSELVLGMGEALARGPASVPGLAAGHNGTGAGPGAPSTRRVGVDSRDPGAIRELLAARGVDVVVVDADDPEGDPSTEAGVLVLHVDDDGAGYDRCRTLRARCADPAYPIIVSIPRHDEESIRSAFAAGADDIVVRPVIGPELLARVDSQLDRVGLRSTLPFPVDPLRHGESTGAERRVDVVIVDDDAALSDLLHHTLRLRGYSVERFFDGARAAAALTGDPPAVAGRAILLDIGLPGLDGIAVLRRLGRAGVLRHTHVLMLTSHAMESEVLNALELGAFDHVAKPFSVPVLMHRLQRALMY